MQVTSKLLGPDPEYANLGGIAASADGSRLFISVGERVGCFDTTAGQIVWRHDQALRNAAPLAVTPAGDRLIAAGHDGLALFARRPGSRDRAARSPARTT